MEIDLFKLENKDIFKKLKFSDGKAELAPLTFDKCFMSANCYEISEMNCVSCLKSRVHINTFLFSIRGRQTNHLVIMTIRQPSSMETCNLSVHCHALAASS